MDEISSFARLLGFLCAAVELGHDKFTMAKSLGGGKATVRRAYDEIEESIACFVECHLALENLRYVEIDVLGHELHGFGIPAEFDHGLDGIANDVSLAGREGMDHC